MTTHTEHPSPRDHAGKRAPYLESAVRTASPARMRLMLIERGVDVAGCLASVWRAQQKPGANEYSIKLLDLLNELLGGVVGGTTEGENLVCHKVADLYVYLVKHLLAAEVESNANWIDEIKTVLEIEAETWRAVCALPIPNHSKADPFRQVPGRLNLEA